MAGLTWFELDIDFSEHPKTLALAVELKNPLAEAYVSRIWAYCYHHATDRFSGPAAVATLEEAARWRGRPGVLVTALLKVGYLEHEGDAIVVHGVADRLQPHVRAKKNAAARQRRHRDVTPKTETGHASVTRDVTRDVPVTTVLQRERERDREETEEESSGSPSAAARGESAEPAAPKKPTDPRFPPLRAAWETEFTAAMKTPYRWQGPKDAQAVHRLIAVPVAEFQARARRALTTTGFPRCATLAELAAKWNHNAGPSPPTARRGMATPSEDWTSEEAKRL